MDPPITVDGNLESKFEGESEGQIDDKLESHRSICADDIDNNIESHSSCDENDEEKPEHDM